MDREGLYADEPVVGDSIDDAVRANLDRLDARQAAIMFEVVRESPFLSPDGRRERLSYLLASRKVTLQFKIDDVEPDVFSLFGAG